MWLCCCSPSKMSSQAIVLTASIQQISFGKEMLRKSSPGPASISIRSLPPWTVKMLRDEMNIVHIIAMKDGIIKKDTPIGKLN